MKSLRNFLIALPLASTLLWAQETQSDTTRSAGQADMGVRSYTGTVVNANCNQASALMNPTSDRAADPSTATSSAKKTISASSLAMAKRDVLRHCQPVSGTNTFALLTDDGNFLKLDDAGNHEVMSQMTGAGGATAGKKAPPVKNMRASITGELQGDTLKVQSISKMQK